MHPPQDRLVAVDDRLAERVLDLGDGFDLCCVGATIVKEKRKLP